MLQNDSSKKYGIFTADKKFASKIIDKYVKSHNCKCIKRIKSSYEEFAVMEDGTKYKWIDSNSCSCGHRMSIGVIDLATCSLGYIRVCILPMCTCAKEDDFVFLDSSRQASDDKSYNLYTLIDRLQKVAAIKDIEKIGFYDIEYGWQPVTGIGISGNELSFDTFC